nr:PREDICTED: zinc finger C2HC domain-containing protein 1A [Equus przewalskii]
MAREVFVSLFVTYSFEWRRSLLTHKATLGGQPTIPARGGERTGPSVPKGAAGKAGRGPTPHLGPQRSCWETVFQRFHPCQGTHSENGSVQVGELLPCKICGRTFFPVALKKHGPICQKTATKKRKTFDSSRQRAEGTDIPTVKPLKPRPEPPKKPSNWRRKHEEFIATIRAAKGLDQALKEGGKLPPPPPPSYDPDYIQCPYCQRRFNENAADRHINFCKEQAARISNKGKFSTDTKGKATSRTQYKPPAPKKSSSPGTALSGSSRLPQPSSTGKTVVGVPSGKVSSVSSSVGNKLQTLSPSHKGIAAPQVGANIKPRNSTPPSLARNPASGVLTSKRRTYTDSYIARPDGDYISSLNGGNIKGIEGNSSGHLPKFCHECGTKYPVEWAKFCCECGIRRMVL